MMRSLSSAVAGLRTHQTKMDVIGNNIANVNTYGFKSSRTSFADVYYQNLSGGREGVAGARGGKNPTQIGYGSAVATVDVMVNVSGSSSTDRAMDVYIAGDGFLVSKDANGKLMYTRLGILGFDSAGNLIDGNGNLVMGFPPGGVSANGTVAMDELSPINYDPKLLIDMTNISISTNGTITGILPGATEISGKTTNPAWINSSQITVTEGSNFAGEVRLAVSGFCTTGAMATALGQAGLTVNSMEMGELALPAGNWDVSVDSKGEVTLSYAGTPPANDDAMELKGNIDKDGKLILSNSGKIGLVINMPAGTALTTASGPNTLPLTLHCQAMTTDKGENAVRIPDPPQAFTGASPLVFSDAERGTITIPLDTSVTAKAFNGVVATVGPGKGQAVTIGNLVLAKFGNPQGLQQSGTSYFISTLNSGEPVFVMPGQDGTGGLDAGYLETSNVDLSKEFTDMITTQRGFQANTRIITVSDEMLQELVNLKR